MRLLALAIYLVIGFAVAFLGLIYVSYLQVAMENGYWFVYPAAMLLTFYLGYLMETPATRASYRASFRQWWRRRSGRPPG